MCCFTGYEALAEYPGVSCCCSTGSHALAEYSGFVVLLFLIHWQNILELAVFKKMFSCTEAEYSGATCPRFAVLVVLKHWQNILKKPVLEVCLLVPKHGQNDLELSV